MQITKYVVFTGIILLMLSSQGYSQASRNVAIFDEDSKLLELGSIEKIGLTVKNAADSEATIDLYIGSTDSAFRNWIWFENHRYDNSRAQQQLILAGHEERHIIVSVLAGRVGDYKLIVGPDGSDVSNMYDSADIRIVHRQGSGIFSDSPGLGFIGILLTLIAASIIILRKGLINNV